MNKILAILEGTYKYPSLRRRKIPLFMGMPGLGKTYVIEEFARKKGVHLELFLSSSKSPLEIDGIGIPNNERTKAVHVEFENLFQ
jgi:SpoVK/Ycf46/Vps4 family AAA+-type ATPase